MGRRLVPVELMWAEGPSFFGFLIDEWGFTGPERTDGGLAYRRPGLHVDIELWEWKHETGFTTMIRGGTDSPERWWGASLGCLYVACGMGTLQAVPEGAWSQHTILKRMGQHSHALRRVMPYLDGPRALDLLRWCHGRELPTG